MKETRNAAVVTCGSCGQRNRIDPSREPDAAVCGRCGRSLDIGRVVEVTDASYTQQVEASSLPVVLDCWAPWCGPCRMVAPAIEELAGKLSGRVKFAKLNVDENPATSARFGVRSIPTLLLVRDGKLAGRIVGAQPAQAILSELEQAGFV